MIQCKICNGVFDTLDPFPGDKAICPNCKSKAASPMDIAALTTRVLDAADVHPSSSEPAPKAEYHRRYCEVRDVLQAAFAEALKSAPMSEKSWKRSSSRA